MYERINVCYFGCVDGIGFVYALGIHVMSNHAKWDNGDQLPAHYQTKGKGK